MSITRTALAVIAVALVALTAAGPAAAMPMHDAQVPRTPAPPVAAAPVHDAQVPRTSAVPGAAAVIHDGAVRRTSPLSGGATAPAVIPTVRPGGGFDWVSALIGGSVSLVLLAGIGVAGAGHRRRAQLA